MQDTFKIGSRTFNSRLLVGTGKYKDLTETDLAIQASGAEIVTVAIRRVNIGQHPDQPNLLSVIPPEKYTILPNTAGCFDANSAVRTCMLARELLDGHNLVKLEVLGDEKTLYPNITETLKAARTLIDDGFEIMVYTSDDPIGAHESGRMGEDPQGIPNNLMPYITQVAIGRRDCLNIFGSDYPTKDGTCVRDYIHVMDLAEGHVKAWQVCGEQAGLHIYNLGTGQGVSVLEMVQAFARASGLDINYKLVDRRPGDVAECWADPAKAQRELGWNASRTIDDMTRDSWRWQQANPNGYEE